MSRLDRLVVLLDTGSSLFIRNTAADQLADSAKSHPEEVLNILARVYPYLKSKSWDTRTAAARAFGGIVSSQPVWDPNAAQDADQVKLEDNNEDFTKEVKQEDLQENSQDVKKEDEPIKLDSLKQEPQDGPDIIASLLSVSDNVRLADVDFGRLINDVPKLVASGDPLLDMDNTKSLTENLRLAKQLLNARLGFGDPSILVQQQKAQKVAQERAVKAAKKETKPAAPLPSTPAPSKGSAARLRAMAKRRAKVAATAAQGRSAPVDLSQLSLSTSETSGAKNEKTEFELTRQADANTLLLETKVSDIALGSSDKIWIFQGLYELLVCELFNPNWEVRHGSALGLKELLKDHARSINRVKGYLESENASRNVVALEDLVAKILTLMALDRFGDYVGDSVVAPVRESTAQALAALLANVDETNPEEQALLERIFAKLISMVVQDPEEFRFSPEKNVGKIIPCWEAAHGAVLALKYAVSIKPGFVFGHKAVFHSVIAVVLDGLSSASEEIQSECAALLVPIIDRVLPHPDWLKKIVRTIWDILESVNDDLKLSLNNVLDLVSALSEHPQVLTLMQDMPGEYLLESLLPKLYPFFRHLILNIRRAVLQTFLLFLNSSGLRTSGSGIWYQDPILLRLVFQNILFEQHQDILNLSEKVFRTLVDKNVACEPPSILEVFSPHAAPLLRLILTPLGISRLSYAMNPTDVLRPNGLPLSESLEAPKRGRKRKAEAEDDLHVNIDAPVLKGDVALLGEEVFIRTRIAASEALGYALGAFPEQAEPLKDIFNQLKQGLILRTASPRIFSALVTQYFFIRAHELGRKHSPELAEAMQPMFSEYLTNPESLPLYRELVPLLKTLRSTCAELFMRFEESGGVPRSKIPILPVVVQGEREAGSNAFSVADAQKVVDVYYGKLRKLLVGPAKFAAAETLELCKDLIIQAISHVQELRSSRNVTVLAASAAALLEIWLTSGQLPPKLNPYIRCLMDLVKSDSALYQKNSAALVSRLIYALVDAKKAKVYEKIVRNLCLYVCVQFPEFAPNKELKNAIFSLEIQKSVAQLHNFEGAHFARVEGAKQALYAVVDHYGDRVFEHLPVLKKAVFEALGSLALETKPEEAQPAVDLLGLVETFAPRFPADLLFEELNLGNVLLGLTLEYSIFRYMAARCLAQLSKSFPGKAVPFMVEKVLPLLKNSGDLARRQGAIEAIYHLAGTMGLDILPYVIFFIVPVLGRMSDSDENIRVLATTTFASIIKLVPLEAGIADPEDMPQSLLEGREKERNFIKELMNPGEIPDYELPVAIKATLRSYQKAGVNWLHFLNKYNLHGILCDDMGLGKTLQTICIVASDHHNRMERHKIEPLPETRRLPSLVVCPPLVMGHWEQEVKQYAPFLSVAVYAGLPMVRAPLRVHFDTADVVVTLYDVVRNDIDFISEKNFNYAVLDEGHIIKNAHSKLSRAVKRIQAFHRLILTGTPIQNNVLELWSLFDFLMPGFLGTEKYFQEKFLKPIAASRNLKTSSKEQEKGALALEALHKQVLPFMLRRLKSEVLNDLPPKLIQDRYCELSEIQHALYSDYQRKKKVDLKDALEGGDVEESGKQHIFQALQYLRKVCNHPALVLSKDHPNYNQVEKFLKESRSDIDDIRHAPKLMELRNLLIECGIGVTGSTGKKSLSEAQQRQQEQQQLLLEGVISQHRALIFCQMREMLDKVELDLLKKHLPNVTYMRLDGSTEPRMRQQMVQKFNLDPSIDVLLLTTKVGGLGLNLTGADTVIFVEHDWNPMNDLQAMDRAHRLGQTRAVNVYRLVTRGTVEEKIMSLQKFKVNVASTVVSQQNNSLSNMDTDQLLDLFDVEERGDTKEDKGEDESGVMDLGLGDKAKKALGSLAEMWDTEQYEDEYDVKKFVKSMKK